MPFAGRKSEATKLYFIFLLLSCVTDFIWMIIYGNQISGAELQELQNEWEDYAFPPVGTAKVIPRSPHADPLSQPSSSIPETMYNSVMS